MVLYTEIAAGGCRQWSPLALPRDAHTSNKHLSYITTDTTLLWQYAGVPGASFSQRAKFKDLSSQSPRQGHKLYTHQRLAHTRGLSKKKECQQQRSERGRDRENKERHNAFIPRVGDVSSSGQRGCYEGNIKRHINENTHKITKTRFYTPDKLNSTILSFWCLTHVAQNSFPSLYTSAANTVECSW